MKLVELSRHVLELALDLLWTHLDVYLVRTAPEAGAAPLRPAASCQLYGLAGGDGDSAGPVGASLLAQLKRELPQAVTDTLLGQVEAALQHPLVGRSHYSFSEAMVRRLRRVTRLHTGA
ncbi:uncharacterized protein LOC119108341 [Pollicipes pollicipes]|uniref:uncharacterized protein LOC119108341 n=1 Tax=Pollicipes pollicipes TaxID=41117 RepID=UPI0018849A5B|nr:uncharacterized protein LOC119108341 [Pollicipes pollicipes]